MTNHNSKSIQCQAYLLIELYNNVSFNRQWFQCVIKTRMFDSDNYCFALIIVNVNEAPRSKSLSTLIQINRRKHDYYRNKFQLTNFVSYNTVARNTVNEISSYHLWPVVHRLKFDQFEICLFFSGSITSNVTQIHYHSEGKVKRKLQYVPENYLSPFLVARVSEESRWELKCRENRLVTAFKTRQKFHFRDIPFTKLKSHTLQQHLWQPHFRATIGQIAWKPGVEYFSKGELSEENLHVCFQIGRQHHVNKKQGRGTVRRRIHFLQSLICFSTKTAFQNKLRFLR